MKGAGYQVRASVDLVRSETFSAKFIGASGFVVITALLPARLYNESPYRLVAIIFAKILEPQSKL